MSAISLKVASKMVVGRLPVRSCEELNLYGFYNQHCRDFDLSYNPPPPGIFLRTQGVTFYITVNGSVTVWGTVSRVKEEKILMRLWRGHLRKFKVKK